MEIGIYGIQFNQKKIKIFQELFNFLNEFKKVNKVSIHAPFLDLLKQNIDGIQHFEQFNSGDDLKKFAFMLCLGGDGAILDTLCLIKDSGIPVLGINTGRLGFLSSISSEQIATPLKAVLNGEYSLDERSILKLESSSNIFGQVNYALNEVTVQKKDSSSMMIIHAYVDDEYLNSYWADGLIISTPTGSTGYNLSCSGPIIVPGSNVFVITPIAPHNLNVRPLIIPNDKKIKLKMEGRGDEFLVALDSRSTPINSSEELIIEKGEFPMNIVRPKDHSFLSTLRNKLTWGLDSRN
ncbi:MAG: NAD+ kinase [Saprospiraceae bacterium]|jgi:NAD+ kinase